MTPTTPFTLEQLATISRVRRLVSDGRLRELRRRAKISQTTLSRAMGVTRAQISEWEYAGKSPLPDTALRIARALEMLEELANEGAPAASAS